MSDRGSAPEAGVEEAAGAAVERRDRDGAAGAGDMLGGLNTGAGDRLGVDEADETGAYDPGPISGHQHDLDEGEPRTDSATTYHSAANLPAEGA
jgi:hypothetical protein